MHKMSRYHRVVVVGVALMLTATIAWTQNNPSAQERREAISAAVTAVGLSPDQVAAIREIRRQRPPEDADQRARRAWRQGQLAKVQAILTDDQKAKVAELQAGSADAKELDGAVRLGLTTRPRQN